MRLLFLLAVLAVGCHSEPRPPSTPEDRTTGRSDTMDGMSEGAGCGGVKALPCKPGLTCKLPAHAVADQGGTCVAP